MNVSTAPRWRKSTRSSASAACVEVAALTEGGVGVRDSKNRDAEHLTVTHGQWAAFLEGVRTDFA